MDECKHHDEFVKEIRLFHLEIKDRLARIETKQDSASVVNDRFHEEFIRLYDAVGEHDQSIAALNSEMKNLKWTAGIVAGIVAGVTEIILYLTRGGK